MLHIEGSLAANAIRVQAQARGVNGGVGGDVSGDWSGGVGGGMGGGMGGGVAKSSGGSSSSTKRRKADPHSPGKAEAMEAEGPGDMVEEDAAVERAEAAAEDEAAASEAEVAARRARNTWLGCDLCGKWRRLGRMKEGELPENWTCAENPDGAYASCEVAQELPDDEIDRLLGLLRGKERARDGAKAGKDLLRAERERAAKVPGMPGTAPPVCGQSLGEVLDLLIEKAKLPADEARAIHWHLANLEYGCATALHNVSLSWWDQDDANDIVGEHVVVTNGYDRMVTGLANYLEVLTEREVSKMEPIGRTARWGRLMGSDCA